MPNTERELMSAISIICQSPPERAICTVCGDIIQMDGAHFCDPDQRVDQVMKSSWRYMLMGGSNPRKRAKGYSVR